MSEFKKFLKLGDEVVAVSTIQVAYSDYIYIFTKFGRIYRFSYVDNKVERLV